MTEDSAAHYDRITSLWQDFMGDNFHFGYFESDEIDLAEAADAMIERMLEPCGLSEESRVLDVGCGVGGPAFFIHERCGCTIDAISTSAEGVRTANETGAEKGYDRVRFRVADGMDNGFPDQTFDLVWIMEASHPIPDKRALFTECFRVLKKGGQLAMCDLVQLKTLPFHKGLWYFITNIKDFLFAPNAWGPARILSMGRLCDHMIEAGFSSVKAIDITSKVIPTMRCWRDSALSFRDGVSGESSRQYLDDFGKACVNLEKAFSDGLMGYGMLFARRES